MNIFITKYKTFFIVLISLIWFLIISFLILTFIIDIPLFKNFNENTAEIWDTFSWIINPFLTLVSIILVYITITQQIKANKLISNQFEENRIKDELNKYFEFINEYMKNFQLDYIEEVNANNYIRTKLNWYDALNKFIMFAMGNL